MENNNIKLLLHVCCAPCAIYPLEKLCDKKINLNLWYYNPNVHSKNEFYRRRDSLAYLANYLDLKVDFSPPYEPEVFLRALKDDFSAPNRCRLCYQIRLSKAAQKTKELNLTHFTTTLLYSKKQNHELIIEEGEKAAKQEEVEFYYQDFRSGWKKGIDISRSLGLYRQNYCGCFYSQM